MARILARNKRLTLHARSALGCDPVFGGAVIRAFVCLDALWFSAR